jgi:hypothetical protein
MSLVPANLRPPSIEEIKSRVDIPAVWRELGMPGEPGKSCRSPLRPDDRNPSFSVYNDGRNFKDHGGNGSQGDVIDFTALARGCTPKEAIDFLRELIGWQPGPHGPAMSKLRTPMKPRPKPDAEPAYKPKIMDGDVRLTWESGLHWLKRDDVMQREIDTWRAWPTGTTRFLAEEGLMAAPEVNGRRSLAFLVQIPMRSAWAEIGFHARMKPRNEGDRAIWIYQPSGVGMPGVPFVLGNFYGARLVITTEGQFDAICFAAAAGWFATESAWPDGVAVLGLRGAGGWRPFIEHWRKVWPRRARFLIIPDNDEPGLKSARDFSGALAPLAASVTILPPRSGGPKDFNAMFKEKPFTPADIYGLLKQLDLMDERGFPK